MKIVSCYTFLSLDDIQSCCWDQLPTQVCETLSFVLINWEYSGGQMSQLDVLDLGLTFQQIGRLGVLGSIIYLHTRALYKRSIGAIQPV